ncbi:MAG: hypothetical protein ACOYM3_19335, partial [Terrimicrobiaceae bacterium]
FCIQHLPPKTVWGAHAARPAAAGPISSSETGRRVVGQNTRAACAPRRNAHRDIRYARIRVDFTT